MKNQTKWYENVFCVLFSIFMVIAYSFEKTDSLRFISKDAISMIYAIVSMIVLSFVSIYFLKWIKNLFSKLMKLLSEKQFKSNRLENLFSNHSFLFSLIVMLIFWLPYAIARYPVVTEWDAYHQIIQGLGYQSINYIWPIASTMFMSTIIKIGISIFGSYNAGAFLLVVIQMILCACCLAYSIKVINQFSISPLFKWIVLVIYSIATIYPRYTTAIVKDSLFSCLVLLFVSIQIDIFILKNNRIHQFVFLFVVALLMSIFRSNGIYIVYFCLPVLLIMAIKNKDKYEFYLVAVLIATVFSFKLYGNFIESKGIKKVPISEALSIPFQQTARYIKTYPDDVTQEEKDAIRAVLQYDVISQNYHPRLSDYVKSTYHGDNKSLIQYFKTWFQQFLRHPLVYMEATFNNCFEFFYPYAIETESGLYRTTNNDENIKIFDETKRHHFLNECIVKFVTVFEKIPVLRFFCNTGFQFWMTIYLVIYAIFEKKGKLFYVLIPSIVGILVCMAGPTYTWNGIRYALPIIYTTPIFLGVFMMDYYQKRKDN